MAFKHGHNAEWTLGTDELTDFSDNIEWSRERDTAESSVFGLDSKTYLGGLRDATFTVSGKYDSTASTGPAAVINAAIDADAPEDFEILVEGTGSSLGSITGSCLATNYTESAPIGDVITWSADFQVTGDVTTTNQSA